MSAPIGPAVAPVPLDVARSERIRADAGTTPEELLAGALYAALPRVHRYGGELRRRVTAALLEDVRLVRILRAGLRTDAAARRGTRVVEITEQALEQIAAAAGPPGQTVSVRWPEPDADGFTNPTFHAEATPEPTGTWLPLPRRFLQEHLDDAPALRSLIDKQLTAALAEEEDRRIDALVGVEPAPVDPE